MSKDKYPSIFSRRMEAIFLNIFAPKGGYCVYYPSNLFLNARSFENWGIFSDICPLDAFRPIAQERKNLLDYKLGYLCADGRRTQNSQNCNQ